MKHTLSVFLLLVACDPDGRPGAPSAPEADATTPAPAPSPDASAPQTDAAPVSETAAETTPATASDASDTSAPDVPAPTCIDDGDPAGAASQCCSRTLDDDGTCCTGSNCCAAFNHSERTDSGSCVCSDGYVWLTDEDHDLRCEPEPLPDLIIDSWGVHQWFPTASDPRYFACVNFNPSGDAVDYGDHLRVKNIGEGWMHTDVRMRIGLVGVGGEAWSTTTPRLTSSLAPGETANWDAFCVLVATGALPAGDYKVRLEIDFDELAEEQSESNNSSSGAGVVTIVEAPPIPPWLIGTYSRRGKTENNVEFEYEDLRLSFNALGFYTHAASGAAGTTGDFEVAGGVLRFIDGALGGTSVTLANKVDSSCRIFYGFGSPLLRQDEPVGCPTVQWVTGSACDDVGTFEKITESGSIGSSGSGSEGTWTDKVVLHRDGVYTVDHSHNGSTCFNWNCHYDYDRSQTKIGRWDPSAGWPYGVIELSSPGWSFTPSSKGCQ